MSRLEELYKTKIISKLQEQFGYKHVMQIPKIEKITINMGVGAAAADKKLIDLAVADLELIAGQKPVITKARKSVASFKIRAGWPIGCKVTLRRKKMYEFFDRLISIYLPRIRDFRGLSKKSFDAQGNYSLGIHEHVICPEIDYDKVDGTRGFELTISTSAKTKEESAALLAGFGFPFKE